MVRNPNLHGSSPYTSRAKLWSEIRWRAIRYGIGIWLLVILQMTFFHFFPVFGQVPDLALLAVFGIALFDGAYAGGICGVYAGFLESALGGAGFALPLLFYFIAVFCGVVLRRSMGRAWVSYMIYGSLICVFRAVLTLATLCISTGLSDFDLRPIFRYTLVPELFCNYLFLVPMYPLLRALCGRASHSVAGT